jgi:hypothetical protein
VWFIKSFLYPLLYVFQIWYEGIHEILSEEFRNIVTQEQLQARCPENEQENQQIMIPEWVK